MSIFSSMPLYEYKCSDCQKVHEVIQKFADAPLEICPLCQGALTKLMSMSSFSLKGSGWYTTDYKKSGASTSSEAASKANGSADGASDGQAKDTQADSSANSTSPSTASPSASPSSEAKAVEKPAAAPATAKTKTSVPV